MPRLALAALVLTLGCDPAADASPPTRVVCRDGVRVATVDGARRRGVCDLDEAANDRCQVVLVAGGEAETVVLPIGRRLVMTADGRRWSLRCRRSGLPQSGPGY